MASTRTCPTRREEVVAVVGTGGGVECDRAAPPPTSCRPGAFACDSAKCSKAKDSEERANRVTAPPRGRRQGGGPQGGRAGGGINGGRGAGEAKNGTGAATNDRVREWGMRGGGGGTGKGGERGGRSGRRAKRLSPRGPTSGRTVCRRGGRGGDARLVRWTTSAGGGLGSRRTTAVLAGSSTREGGHAYQIPQRASPQPPWLLAPLAASPSIIGR